MPFISSFWITIFLFLIIEIVQFPSEGQFLNSCFSTIPFLFILEFVSLFFIGQQNVKKTHEMIPVITFIIFYLSHIKIIKNKLFAIKSIHRII